MTDLLHARPRRSVLEHVERVPDGAVVHPMLAGPVALNPTAMALWELCDGRTEVSEMVEAVATLFALDRATAQQDVQSALEDMMAAGVIR